MILLCIFTAENTITMANPIIIAVANHKGGVGKTASTATLSAILASKGKKVLMIDLDTQSNLTRHFLEEIPERVIYHAIRERKELPIYEVRENLDIVPSSLDMAGIEIDMTSMRKREYILRDLLAPVQEDYDFIFMDCPPSLGLISLNALTAANKVLIPMKADLMSYYGLSMMDKFLADMQDLNPGIQIDFIFFNIYEKGQILTESIENDVRANYGDRVMKTYIRKNNEISKAAFGYTDIVSYNPNANGSKDFKALAEELLEKVGK